MQVLIASRQTYNSCLEELITHYQETGKYLHLYEVECQNIPCQSVLALLVKKGVTFYGFFSRLNLNID